MLKLLEANGIGAATSAGLGHVVARRHAKAVDLATVEGEYQTSTDCQLLSKLPCL